MATILTRTSGLNPFFCNGKKLEFIEFTQNGSPICCVNRGWFDHRFSSNNLFEKVILPFEVKNKRVYSTKVESFLIKATNDYKDGYKLVIPVEWLENVSLEKDVKKSETAQAVSYCDILTFDLTGEMNEPVKDEIKGIIWRNTGLKTHTVKQVLNYRNIPTEYGKQLSEFSAKAKSVGVKLYEYDFNQLLKVFNISLK